MVSFPSVVTVNMLHGESKTSTHVDPPQVSFLISSKHGSPNTMRVKIGLIFGFEFVSAVDWIKRLVGVAIPYFLLFFFASRS